MCVLSGGTRPAVHSHMQPCHVKKPFVFSLQVITLEGWVDIMYYVMDAHSFYNFIYFILLIIVSIPGFTPPFRLGDLVQIVEFNSPNILYLLVQMSVLC